MTLADAMNSPLEAWLERFQQEPMAQWQGLLAGSRPLPGYQRGNLAESLHMVIGESDDPARELLDATLTQWLPEFLAWDDRRRRRFGLSGYSLALIQACDAATLIHLDGFREHLYRQRALYLGQLPSLVLAPSRDPLAAYFHTLALSRHAPDLASQWLRLCREAGERYPTHYLAIGLLGLRQLPMTPDETPPWLRGLAAWSPPTQKAFQNEFRTLRVFYPRSPGQWRQWCEPLLPTLDPLRREWWEKELGKRPSTHVATSSLHSPYPHELDAILPQFRNAGQQAEAELRKLFADHERYVRQTGDTFSFVCAANKAAQRLLKLGQPKLALELVRRALEHEPWNAPNWHLQGRCLLALGHAQAAEWIFWEGVRRGVNLPSFMAELGRLLADQGRGEEAEALFREAFRINPDDDHVRTELGRLLAGQGRGEEAEALFREAFRIDPKHVHSRTELGRLLADQGRAGEAEALFREAFRIDPKHVHSRTELGLLLADQGRDEEAEVLFREAFFIDPEDVHTLTELRRLTERQEQFEAARAVYQAGLVIAPDDGYLQKEMERVNQILTTGDSTIPMPRYDFVDDGVGELGPPPPEQTALFNPLRLPALAKRADVLLSHAPELGQEARKSLRALILDDQDGKHGVVRYYAHRHGLLETPWQGESDSLAWRLDDAVDSSDDAALRNLAHEEEMPRWVWELVRVVQGEEKSWERLRDWPEQRAPLGPLDAVVHAGVEELRPLELFSPSFNDKARAILRRVSEAWLETGTELMITTGDSLILSSNAESFATPHYILRCSQAFDSALIPGE